MKFIISSKELKDSLKSLSLSQDKKSIMPILEDALFESTEKGVRISASNLEVFSSANINVENHEKGEPFCVSLKDLLSLMSSLEEQPVVMQYNGSNNVKITTEKGIFSFNTSVANEFPVFPEDKKGKEMKFNTPSFLRGIKGVSFCTASDELRPSMCGVFMEVKKKKLTLVASDAHKLAMFEAKTEDKTEVEFIIPKKTVKILEHILKKKESDLEFTYNEKWVKFSIDGMSVLCRNDEGNKYPNFRGVIREKSDIHATIDSKELKQGIKTMNSTQSKVTMLIEFDFSKGQLAIKSRDLDYGKEGSYTIQYEKRKGKEVAIGFRSLFLSQIIKNIKGGVVFHIDKPSNSVNIYHREQPEEKEELSYLLMPMMLNK